MGELPTRNKKLIMPSVFVIAIMVFSLFGVALTSPINTTIIVPLSNNKEVSYTTIKLQQLLPNSMVISQSDFLYEFYLQRNLGNVIFVSHGTKNGILIKDRFVQWDTFVDTIKRTASTKVFLASCYSDRAVELAKKSSINKEIYGFRGYVDVDEAAYTVAALVNYFNGNTNKAFNLITQLTEIMYGKVVEPWKYKLWLLRLDPGNGGGGGGGDLTHTVRGIWWIAWKDFSSIIKYTHPNTYRWASTRHYYNINPNEDRAIYGDNFDAYHIAKATVDAGISALKWLIGKIVEALLIIAFGPEIDIIARAVGFIVSYLVGVILYDTIPDETGAAWAYIKDFTLSAIGIKCDIKIGKSWWFRFQYGLISLSYPIWYGDGRNLGIGGI